MRDDTLTAAILRQMIDRVGDRQAREWANALGLKAALQDHDRRVEVDFVVRQLEAGHSRVDIAQRLIARGVSRPTAYRRLREGLDQRRLRREKADDDHAGIQPIRGTA